MKKAPIIVVVSLLLAPLGALRATDAPRPNILVIFADDLGYADLGCQGSPDVKTPHIDSLAAHGVRCTAGYVTAPQCSPSRAALLSGRYQQRFGHESNSQMPVMLTSGAKTMADHLKAAGYATGHFGKWHLGAGGPPPPPEAKPMQHPLQHGFDESFGYFDYESAVKDGSLKVARRGGRDERVFAAKAADFIARHAEKPWFVYLALHSPHTPHVDYGGYSERFKEAAPDRVPVLAMMAQQDEAVHRVLSRLRELKLEEDTLIFYISDNGGTKRTGGAPEKGKHAHGSINTPFAGDKGTVLEGGIRVPFIVQWKKGLPAGKVYDRPVISLDVLPTALAAARAQPLAGPALDGVNLLPFLKGGQSDDPHPVLFWRWHAEQAARQGDWKLVRGKDVRNWRLVDLKSDVREEKDLSARHPEKAAELLRLHEQWTATLPPVGQVFKDTEEGDGQKPGKPKRQKGK